MVELSYNPRNGLLLLEYSRNKEGRKFVTKKISGNVNVKEYLASLPRGIIGTIEGSGINDMVFYKDFYILIRNYDTIKATGILDDYFDSIEKYEKEKVSSIAPRVQRKNKFVSGQKIAAAFFAMLLLLYSYLIATGIFDIYDFHDYEGISKETVIERVYDDLDIKDDSVYEHVNMIKTRPTFYDDIFYDDMENTREEIYDNDTHVKSDRDVIKPSFLDADSIQIVEKEQVPNLNKPVNEIVFDEVEYVCIDYSDRTESSKLYKTKELYLDMLTKYANMYGLDPNLVVALATQERGVHSSEKDAGGATGLMQIQNSVWLDKTLTVHNFETGELETIYITEETLQNCETNIKLGCMILRECMNQNNFNIVLGLQAYNMGTWGIDDAVKKYAAKIGSTYKELVNNPYDCGWLDYREGINGDPLYVEHVFSYIGPEFQTYVYKSDGTKVVCNIRNNENVKTRH